MLRRTSIVIDLVALILSVLLFGVHYSFDQRGLEEEVGKSLIRLGFLTVVPQSRIVDVIGSVSSARHQRLLRKLSD